MIQFVWKTFFLKSQKIVICLSRDKIWKKLKKTYPINTEKRFFNLCWKQKQKYFVQRHNAETIYTIMAVHILKWPERFFGNIFERLYRSCKNFLGIGFFFFFCISFNKFCENFKGRVHFYTSRPRTVGPIWNFCALKDIICLT